MSDSISSDTLICTHCNTPKPLSEFYNKAHTGHRCKECCKIYQNERYQKIAAKGTPQKVISEKRCYKCKEIKPIEELRKDHGRIDGYSAICKKCHSRSECPLPRHRSPTWVGLGVTKEIYDKMFAEQNGLCAICKKPETVVDRRNNTVRRLAVDHDHSTGMIRRLLCMRCNLTLGMAEKRKDDLSKMLKYIEEHTIK